MFWVTSSLRCALSARHWQRSAIRACEPPHRLSPVAQTQTHQTHCSTEPEKADKNKNFKNTPIKETCTLIHTLTVTFGGSGGGNPCLRVELRRRKQSEKELNYLIGLCDSFCNFHSTYFFHADFTEMIPYKQAPEEYKVFKIMFKV